MPSANTTRMPIAWPTKPWTRVWDENPLRKKGRTPLQSSHGGLAVSADLGFSRLQLIHAEFKCQRPAISGKSGSVMQPASNNGSRIRRRRRDSSIRLTSETPALVENTIPPLAACGKRPSLRRRSMVVHNLPSLGKLAEHEREQTLRRLALGHRQLPRTAHKGRVLTQHLDAQAGEFQLPHFVPGTSIHREITVHCCLPSVMLFGAREEGQLRRIPIARHKTLEIVPVPGFLLLAQDALNGFPVVAVGTLRVLGRGSITGREEHDQAERKRENAIKKETIA